VTLAGGTDRFSRNFGNYQYTQCNIPEERSIHPYCGGSLKSATWKVFTPRYEMCLSIQRSYFVPKLLISVLLASAVLSADTWGLHFNRSETRGF